MNRLSAVFVAVLGLTIVEPGPQGISLGISQAHAGCADTAVPGVDWSGCRKRNLIMSEFDFTGASFARSDLSSSDLRAAILDDVDFRKANLFRASLRGAKAQGANFENVIASRTDFRETDLTDANFLKAETNRVDFKGAKLSNSDLSKAEFARAVFTDANISGVKFDNTNLARSDFRGANFEEPPTFLNAYFFQTRIEGVDLSKVSDLAQWQIDLACGDSDTKLPEGFKTPANWPCEIEADEG